MTERDSIFRTLVETAIVLTIAGLSIYGIAMYRHNAKMKVQRRNSCVGNLRQIDGAKDQYALDYGGTNGDMFTWHQLSIYMKDISNKAICQSSSGRMTNIPNDCYSIEPLGWNPRCRVTEPKDSHALTNR